MTCLQDWKHLAIIENRRARRSWQGLENEKAIKVVAFKRATEGTQRTEALRVRIHDLHLEGLNPDEIAEQFGYCEAVVWKNLRGLYTVRENRLFDGNYPGTKYANFLLRKQHLDLTGHNFAVFDPLWVSF